MSALVRRIMSTAAPTSAAASVIAATRRGSQPGPNGAPSHHDIVGGSLSL